MKIIQSFAKFKDGNPRLNNLMQPSKVEQKDKQEKEKLLFYSFLLSYLTLKKYYGAVTIYCNKTAREFLIKYIPYDQIKIMENRNDMMFWSYYKIDVIKTMKTDFIHVDTDVFIFADVFRNFINNKTYDNLVQNTIAEGNNYVRNYVSDFRDYVVSHDIIDPRKYDGRCHSCGVFGMRKNLIGNYVEIAEKMRQGFIEGNTTDYGFIGMAVEELASYLYSIKNNLKTYETIPYSDIIKYGGEHKAADYHNYTHLYLDNKFKPNYVKLVRRKTLKLFPEAIQYIERFEKEMMKNSIYLKQIQ